MKKALALISSFAIITVAPNGKILEQVLGDSTLQVKSVAEGVAVANGKIELSNAGTINTKEDLVEVEARGNSNDLKIAASGNEFNIGENGIVASTAFPITIDPVKNELSVTTSSGERVVTVLPYEAALVVKRGKFIDDINSNQITLSEDSKGELQYLIKGERNINLFNLATIKADVSSNVSASTGEILKLDEPQWLRLFGFLFS